MVKKEVQRYVGLLILKLSFKMFQQMVTASTSDFSKCISVQ